MPAPLDKLSGPTTPLQADAPHAPHMQDGVGCLLRSGLARRHAARSSALAGAPGMTPAAWRVPGTCHSTRHSGGYQGVSALQAQLA